MHGSESDRETETVAPTQEEPASNQRTAAGGGSGIHPLRHIVMAETNARPSLPIVAPCICEHLVFLSGELDAQRDWEKLREISLQFGQTLGAEVQQQLVLEGKDVVFKWERHTEFCSYTAICKTPRSGAEAVFGHLIAPGLLVSADAETAPATVGASAGEDTSSLDASLGKPLVAMRFYIDTPQDPRWTEQGETTLLSGTRIVAITTTGGRARIMSDFAFHCDGFSRILVCDDTGSPNRAGRLVQRLIDIETYRTLALIAWPVAKSAGRDIGLIDDELRRLIQEIGTSGPTDQARLLSELTGLAARAETVGAEANFRFSAAKAYHSIVESRLAELREERIDSYQRLTTFVERRLGPAIRSFQAILDRQASTSQRIARASSLLRARVDVELERQNQQLLASMDRRSRLQLRLQQTVEGLSVAAVSYYCIGILSWLLKGIPKPYLPIDSNVITTVSAPFIVLSVWLMVRRIRKSAHDDEKAS